MRFTAIVFVLLCVPCVTFAQEQEITEDQINRSRELYVLGEEAYINRQWAQCADNFERSFSIVFSPELLYNIGRCYEELATTSGDPTHYGRAITAYTRYIREAHVEDTDALDLKIYRLSEALAHLEESTEIVYDYDSVLVPEEEVFDEPVVTSYHPPALIPRNRETPVPDSRFWWPATLYLGTATFVMLVATIITGVISLTTYNDLESTCGGTTAGCDSNDISKVNSLSTATNVLIGLTGALLVATGVAFYFEFSAHDGEASPSAFGLRFTESF